MRSAKTWRKSLDAELVDHLDERPVRRRRVVLGPGARLPVEPPGLEPLAPQLAVGALLGPHRRAREASGVGEQVLDRDVLLAVRGELRHDVGDPGRVAQQPVADQQPGDRRR